MSEKITMGGTRRDFLRWGFSVVGATTFAPLLAACGDDDNGGGDNEAAGPSTLRVRSLAVVNFANILYLESIASEHDLSIEYREFPTGTEALDALIAGEIEVAPTGETQPILLRSQGVPLKVICGTSRKGKGLIVAKGIETFDDLRGKDLGGVEGSGPTIFMIVKLRDEGLDPDNDVTIVNVPFEEMQAAVETERVAGASAGQPTIANFELGGGNVLSYLDDTRLGETDGVLAVTDKFIADKPDVVQNLVTAMVDATRQLEDVNVVIKTMQEVSDVSEEAVRKSLEHLEIATLISADEMDNLAQVMGELELIEEIPDTDEYLDTSFLESVTQ